MSCLGLRIRLILSGSGFKTLRDCVVHVSGLENQGNGLAFVR